MLLLCRCIQSEGLRGPSEGESSKSRPTTPTITRPRTGQLVLSLAKTPRDFELDEIFFLEIRLLQIAEYDLGIGCGFGTVDDHDAGPALDVVSAGGTDDLLLLQTTARVVDVDRHEFPGRIFE